MAIQFFQPDGATPLPAGITVAITQGGTAIGSGTTDGTGSISVAVTQALAYLATFSGTFTGTQTFVGGSNQKRLSSDAGSELTDDSGNNLVQSTGTVTSAIVTGYVTNNARVTQAPMEVLAEGTALARVTQLGADVLAIGTAKARVTQATAEVLATGEARAIITQIALEVLVQNTPSDVRVTQAVLKALTKKASNVRLTQAVLKSLSAVATPQYTVQDFVTRIVNLLPKPWFSRAALQPGGTMYVLIFAVASALAGHKILQLDFDKNQMRILTASGANLDNISLDYLGDTLPRITGETDASYRLRIINAIIGPKVTLAAMQAAVNQYFTIELTTLYSQRPTGLVYDQQSNPTLAAANNINPPQFVIQVDYPMPAGTGWVIGQKGIGINNPLLNTVDYLPYSPAIFDPGLMTVVDEVRAYGTKPVYLGRIAYY